MKRALKILLILIVVALITIQFFRPSKNSGVEDAQKHITAVYPVPDDVQNILKASCYDCHSNTTQYPWYSRVQPMGWVLENHIVEGKKELNFSEFASYPVSRQYKELEEISEDINEGEMPLLSYSIAHKNARLTAHQKALIHQWVAATKKEMESRYGISELKDSE